MSNDKALAIVPRTLDEVSSLAEVLAKSTLLPDALKGKAPDVVVQILAGQELGLSPMASIRGVHIVQGKPVLSADTMVALVLGSGLCEYFSCVEDTDARVTYETKRKGSPHAQRVSWSVEDTKRAGLNTKDNWRLYTRQMMKARAKAILARDAYPDVLAGCYEADSGELSASTVAPRVELTPAANTNADVVDAEIVGETTGEDTAINAINAAADMAALQALVPRLNALKGEERTAAKKVYDARKAALSQPIEAAS